MSLLQDATEEMGRLKMLVYGKPGCGKSWLSLHFPNVAVIDTEKGTTHYGKHFKFKRIYTDDIDTVNAVVDELLVSPGDIKTLVIDSFTVINDNIIKKIEQKMKLKTGKPDYTLQPLDQRMVKKMIRDLFQKLMSLDMNVIVTAREAIAYETSMEGKGLKMEAVGTKPECHKDVPYYMDIFLELKKDTNGKYFATVQRDRTNTLDPVFEHSYENFAKFVGLENLERTADISKQQNNIDSFRSRNVVVVFNGTETKTAGITGDQVNDVQKFMEAYKNDAKVLTKLKDEYEVESFLDLKEDEAAMFIRDLQELA